MNPVPRPPKQRANLTAHSTDVNARRWKAESNRRKGTHLTVPIGEVINERGQR